MEIFVGTSGWFYEWNKEETLDWYIENAGLNAVELNASFYRFPFPNQIKAWAKKGKGLHWVIKVNRLITHQYKFSIKAVTMWQRFLTLFSPMMGMIDYFLFQLPPNLTTRTCTLITNFVKKTGVKTKFALEPRNETWFKKEVLAWAEFLGLTWVSIDAPEFSRGIFKTTKNVYLRIHGRTTWYHHDYSDQELEGIARRIVATKPERIYIFFNNNHNMLTNAQQMLMIFKRLVKGVA